MTDVIWELVHEDADIEPKGAGGTDKNIVPQGTGSVGTRDYPWEELWINKSATINKSMEDIGPVLMVFGDGSSSDARVLIGASSTGHRVFLACAALQSTDSDARVILAQENTEADIAVASFKQRNDSAPFLDFEGDVAADASKNISSGNGNGSVVGPQAKNTAAMGWTFDKMIKQRITPEAPGEPYDIWLPGFQPDV